MSTVNVAKEPNWKECAIALNRKLNLIGARLKLIEKQSLIYDVCQTAKELVEEFHLDTEQKFIHPEVRDLSKRAFEVSALLSALRFTPVDRRLLALDELHQKASSLASDISMLEAFV